MLHSAEVLFGKRTNQEIIKDVMGGPMGSRYESLKQYKKSEHKWKKELRALKKQY